MIHEGIIHKGDKFAPKGDTAIFRSGPTGKGSNVGSSEISNLGANKISSNARNKVLSTEEMSDMGNVSAQQNVSYSESGKKKKQIQTEGGALDTGARLLIPGYDAYQEYKAGNYGKAALSGAIDVGAAALTPITGGGAWLARTAGKTALKAGAGKAVVKGAEKNTAKSNKLGNAADIASVGADLSSGSSGSSGSSTIPGALASLAGVSLAPQLATRRSASSTRARKVKSVVKEDSTVPNEGNAATASALSAAGAPQEESGKKKKLKEESGTADRRTIENVARPNSANSPFDRKSKLAKNSEIKQKVIDENVKRLSTVREAIEYKKQQDIEEGSIGDFLKSTGSGLKSGTFNFIKGFGLGVTGQAYPQSNWGGRNNNDPDDDTPPEEPDAPKKPKIKYIARKPKVSPNNPGPSASATFTPPGATKPMSEAAPENTIHTIRKNTIMGAVADKKRANKETPVEFNPTIKTPDPNSTAS